MKVLIAIFSDVAAWNIPAAHVERLAAGFPHHRFAVARADEAVALEIEDAEAAFLSELRPEQFAAARQLRWIHSPAAGVGGMLFPALRDSGVIITNSRTMSADTIAEHVIALILAVFRKLPLAFRSQSARHWSQDETMQPPPIRTIQGSRVVVVGLGGIGAATAARLAALGATVVGVRRRPEAAVPHGVAQVVGQQDLLSVLPDADALVLAAPQTAETRGLIDAAALRVLPPRAVLINVSRGKLVDEAALAAALVEGRLAGAGLDVFAHEPLENASPLWALPNVIITPHVAGFRPDHWDAATALFAHNLHRYDRGEPLSNVVDKRAGY